MKKRYVVELTSDERDRMETIVSKGKAAAYKIKHANILLSVDQGKQGTAWTDKQAAQAFGCHRTTVEAMRKRFVFEGFDAAIDRKREGVGRPRKIDGDVEAKMTMIACSEPPEGRARWTVRMIADKLVEMEVVDSCSRMSVQRAMKKTS